MASPTTTPARRGILDSIEWIGNALPDPITLFAIGAVLVMLLSWMADRVNLTVHPELPQPVMQEVVDPETGRIRLEPVIDPQTGRPMVDWRPTGEVLKPKDLLSRDGIDWAFRNMVNNFRLFPPLGVVLVGMLGIGVAERTGLLAAALKAFMLGLRGTLETVAPREWKLADMVLTPAMVFIGIMSSLATDAGYVVLPPLAAALYKSVGRSPLAGMAAVFAGVSAGFSANLFITGLEPMLAELTAMGAVIVEEGYRVNPMCNWWFMIGSTILITFVGWGVTSWIVERRLNRRPPEEGGPTEPTEDELTQQQLNSQELRGLGWAGGALLAFAIVTMSLILIPGAPLYTYKAPLLTDGDSEFILRDAAEIEQWNRIIRERRHIAPGLPGEDGQPPDALPQVEDPPRSSPGHYDGESADHVEVPRLRWIIAERWEPDPPGAAPPDEHYQRPDGTIVVRSDRDFNRWVDVIVPLLFFGFLIPGIAYGLAAGVLKSDKDVARLMIDSMAAMAPIIVLAFVAGQFIGYFSHSGLDRMMAMSGGIWLGKAGFSPYVLIVAFILVTLLFNLFMGSMTAKYVLFAPIFVPMFMLVGISPELTQAAYRVGDSVSNIITPLNAYLIIILVFMRRYVPRGGMGTLIATMFPYTVVFTIVWTAMLLVWMWTGAPLGIDGDLWRPLQ